MKININANTQADATELHLAAKKGKLEDCKRLYSANNKLEEDEITEALCAVSFDSLTDSQDQWVRTHSGDCFPYSELALCLESNLKHPLNRSYLGKMALANIVPWKQTPMHYAIAAKHPSIVEFFLSHHEFTAIEVYQLLQFAAYCSNRAISELIYSAWQSKGGDIPNEAHYTPLMIALMNDQETSQFLLNTIDYTIATKHRCPEGKSLFCYLTLSLLAWEGNIPHNLKASLHQNLLALLQQDLSTEDKKLYSRYSRLTMSQKVALYMMGNNIITKDNYSELGDDVNQALRIELFMAIQQGDINFLNDLALYQKEFHFNFSVDGEHILEAALNSPEPKAFKIILNYMQRNEQSVQEAFIGKFFDKLLPAAPEKLIEPLEQILEFHIFLNKTITLSKTAQLVICDCLTLAAFQGRDKLLDTYKRVNLSPKMSTEALQDMSSSAKKLIEALHLNNKSDFMDMFAELYQRMPNFMSRPLAYVTIIRNEQAREWMRELISNDQTGLSSVLPCLLDYALSTNDNDLFTSSIGFLSLQNRKSYMAKRASDALDYHRQQYSHISILQKNGFNVNNITMNDDLIIIHAFKEQRLPLFQICCEGIEKHPIQEDVLNQLYAMMIDQELSPAPYMQLLAKAFPLNQVQLEHAGNKLTLLEYGVKHNKDWLVALCLKQEEDLGFSKEQKKQALMSAIKLNSSSIVRMLLFCGAIDPFIDKFLPNNTLGYLTLAEHVRFSQKIWLKKLLCEYSILQGQAATHLIQDLVRQHINSLKIVSDGKSYSVLTYAVVHEKDWLFDLCLECSFSGDTSELRLAALYQAIIHSRQQYFEEIIEYFEMGISEIYINLGTKLSLMEHAIITNKMFLLEHCAKAFNSDNLSAWANCIAIALETDDQAALRIMAQHIHFDTPPKKLGGLENVFNRNQEEVFRTLVKMGYVSPNETYVHREALFLYALNHQKDWLMEACLLDTSNPIKCDDDIERAFKYALEGNKTELISALLSRFEETVLDVRFGHAYPTILKLENEDLRSALLTRMLKTTDKLREQKALFDNKDSFWNKMSVEALNCPSFNIESLSSDDYYHMSHQQLNVIVNRSRPSWKKVIDLLISMSPIAAIKMTVKIIKSYFHTTSKQPPSRSEALLGPTGLATQANRGNTYRLDLEDAASLERRDSQYRLQA